MSNQCNLSTTKFLSKRPSIGEQRYISWYIVHPSRSRKAKRKKKEEERKISGASLPREERWISLLESFSVLERNHISHRCQIQATNNGLIRRPCSSRVPPMDIPKYTKPGNIAICRFDGNCIHAAHRSNAPPRINWISRRDRLILNNTVARRRAAEDPTPPADESGVLI